MRRQTWHGKIRVGGRLVERLSGARHSWRLCALSGWALAYGSGRWQRLLRPFWLRRLADGYESACPGYVEGEAWRCKAQPQEAPSDIA